MRVIAGRFGGRRLSAPRGARTRPTADRVREALFSVLGDLEGARVLDLFAGSGALGIEALSRGAAEATFVDSAPAALRALRENLTALDLEAEVRRADARGFLRSARKAGREYDLVFLDPPYRRAAALTASLTGTFPRCSRRARGSRSRPAGRRPSALRSRCSTSAATATP